MQTCQSASRVLQLRLHWTVCLHFLRMNHSPELMKDAIMPLNLTRASCSSLALVDSDSLGSADLGMPMETASCRASLSCEHSARIIPTTEQLRLSIYCINVHQKAGENSAYLSHPFISVDPLLLQSLSHVPIVPTCRSCIS